MKKMEVRMLPAKAVYYAMRKEKRRAKKEGRGNKGEASLFSDNSPNN